MEKMEDGKGKRVSPENSGFTAEARSTRRRHEYSRQDAGQPGTSRYKRANGGMGSLFPFFVFSSWRPLPLGACIFFASVFASFAVAFFSVFFVPPWCALN
jgi:hypothetical protein